MVQAPVPMDVKVPSRRTVSFPALSAACRIKDVSDSSRFAIRRARGWAPPVRRDGLWGRSAYPIGATGFLPRIRIWTVPLLIPCIGSGWARDAPDDAPKSPPRHCRSDPPEEGERGWDIISNRPSASKPSCWLTRRSASGTVWVRPTSSWGRSPKPWSRTSSASMSGTCPTPSP